MAPKNYNKKLKGGGERSDLSPYEECVIQGITDLGDKVVSKAFEKTHDISKSGIEAVKKTAMERCAHLLQAAPVKGGRSRAMTLRQRKKLSKRKRQKKTSRTKRSHKRR